MKRSQPLHSIFVSPARGVVGGSAPRPKAPSLIATSEGRTFSIGLDPGLTEAGICLVEWGSDEDSMVLEYGLVVDKFGAGSPTVLRAQAVAAHLVSRIMLWLPKHRITVLDIGIETPVYNRNPDSHAKQWATVQAIESLIAAHVAPALSSLWITEVGPSESKRLATGDGAAAKDKIYSHSPFRLMPALMEALEESSRHTLSDAWAHSLCTYGRGGTRMNIKAMNWPEVRGE